VCAPLGDRIELAYGKALREEDRKPGDVDVYGSNGRVGAHDAALVNGPGILVGRKGTVGAVHYAPRPFWPIDTVYYVVQKTGDNLQFLHHLLDHLPLVRLNAATGVPGLSRRDAHALRGAFPPPEEQTAITRILDAVDTALERTRLAVDRARDVKWALAQRVFAEGVRREPQSKTAIGVIPRSWQVVPLSSVVGTFQYGLSVPMDQKGKLPILRMGNIQSGEVILSDLKYVSLPEKIVSPYLLKRGDVLFNRTNSQDWVGKVGIYRHDRPSVFASYLIRLLPEHTKVDNYYLGQVLGSYSAQCRIKRYATPGVQQVNINATNLGKVLIPLPVGDEGLQQQREIAALLEGADAVIRSYEPVLAAQKSLKASLMHELLTGQVRVRAKVREAAE
jgi:type I restriction enzyme S subunit